MATLTHLAMAEAKEKKAREAGVDAPAAGFKKGDGGVMDVNGGIDSRVKAAVSLDNVDKPGSIHAIRSAIRTPRF